MPTDRLGTNPAPLEDYPPAALCSLACLAFALADYRSGLAPGRGDWPTWQELGASCLVRLQGIDPDEDTSSPWDELATTVEGEEHSLEECANAAWSCFWLYVDSWNHGYLWDSRFVGEAPYPSPDPRRRPPLSD